MNHSVSFGEYNTWNDWGLVPSTRPIISPGRARGIPITSSLFSGEIEGGDLDDNGILFTENRIGDWEFIFTEPLYNYIDTYSEIMNAIHGRILPVTLEDDPDNHYVGLIQLTSFTVTEDSWKLTIRYNLQPKKIQNGG